MERREFLKSFGAALGALGLPWFVRKASGNDQKIVDATDSGGESPKYICYPEVHIFPDRKILEPLIKQEHLFRSILIDQAIVKDDCIFYPSSITVGGEAIKTWELMGNLPEKFKKEWIKLRSPRYATDPNVWAVFTNYELWMMVHDVPSGSYDHDKQP